MISIRDFFRNLPINSKLLLGYSSIFAGALLLGGLVIYSLVRNTIESNIESELSNTTATIQNMVRTAVSSSIRNYLRAVAETNRDIIQQVFDQYQTGLISLDEAKLKARKILLSQTIGRTGYIYVVDSTGCAPIHPNPGVEGRNYMDRAFVRYQVRHKEGYLEYEWQNPGEAQAQPKALYMTYFEPWDWIISASSYRSEFLRLVNISDFRDSILALKFGQTGYCYVVDTKGNLIVHPQLSGNRLDATDAQGNYFLRRILKMKNGKLTYSWKNPDEKEFRDKLVFFKHIPEFNWIVASSCYLDEAFKPLATVRNIIIATMAGALLLLLPVTVLIGTSITKPLRSLMGGLERGASGDLTVRVAPGNSSDELGRLAGYFNNFMERLEEYSGKIFAEVQERKHTEAALRESESKYRTILERMEEGYYEVDPQGCFVFFNDSFSSLLGYSKKELLKMRVEQITDAENTRKVYETFINIRRRGGKTRAAGCELIKKDGTKCFVETSVSAMRNSQGAFIGFRGVLRDVTVRKQSEEALRLSEEMFSKAFRSSPSGIIIVTRQEGRIVNVNDSFIRFTGFDQEDLLGKDFHAVGFFKSRRRAGELLKMLDEKQRLTSLEIDFYNARGEKRMGLISAETVELWGEDCMLAALEDVTEAKRLEREILEISEREHQKIGRDIHDDLCPHLIGVEVLSSVLERKLRNKGSGQAEDAGKIRLLVQDSIGKLRRLARGLCPLDLGDHSIDSTLSELTQYVEEVFGVPCRLACDSPVRVSDQTVATHIYYIAHEAVHNAVKHSEAGNINMELSTAHGLVVLTIEDDGVGLGGPRGTLGMGLNIMKYRAKRIGADLHIGPRAGGGTVVNLEIASQAHLVH